jgi:hypothetical protein
MCRGIGRGEGGGGGSKVERMSGVLIVSRGASLRQRMKIQREIEDVRMGKCWSARMWELSHLTRRKPSDEGIKEVCKTNFRSEKRLMAQKLPTSKRWRQKSHRIVNRSDRDHFAAYPAARIRLPPQDN